MSNIENRKNDHLDICAKGDIEHQNSTLLEEVQFFHEALPEHSLDEIDLSSRILGRELEAPILISGMTGGTENALEVNHALAQTAQKWGLGMGLGSQRAMLMDPERTRTYAVRDVAPDILLMANIGSVQARDCGALAAAELVDAIGADALCIHLNVAQEIVQDEGDRDFRGCLETFESFAKTLKKPMVAKETGCGLSPQTIRRLRDAGVQWVDVAGGGGTSWTAVESQRGSARQQALGATLRNWGIPTAASVAFAPRAGMKTIASGGIRSGLDAARALALGADAVSLALPFLRAYANGGETQLHDTASSLIAELQAIVLLCGGSSPASLREVPKNIGPALQSWLSSGESTD